MQHQADPRISASVLEALIKAGVILLLVLFCYQVLAPFMALMLWALVLAITLYPAHQKLTPRVGNKPGLAATLIVLFGVLLLVVPSGFLLSSVADTVSPLIGKMQSHSLQIPPPQEQVASWPLIGPKLYALWQQAASDLQLGLNIVHEHDSARVIRSLYQCGGAHFLRCAHTGAKAANRRRRRCGGGASICG